ncbi:uncharacterized protein OCT59_010218 [Rhizophagus irregularis]|uniref:HIT-type domain-containing protein n=1 Tax=Rhizophagus irregularis TaxID=588596 RepID=A0A916EES9_9GLOM|nr:hypothetical protein OCT59_010218 [Rhizophagus irregularis]CAB5382010.1 unnamed protein product [Rhizophagus irregularis]
MLQTPNWHESKEIDEATRRKYIEIHLNELVIKKYQNLKFQHIKSTSKRSFKALLDKSKIAEKPPDVQDVQTYLTVAAKPSRYPLRKFCSVRVFVSAYACKKCGMKYCSLKKQDV